MRLEDEKHDGGYIKQDKRVVKHSRAGLVVDTVAKIMYDASNRKYCDKTYRNKCRRGHLGKVGYVAEFHQLRKVTFSQCEVIHIDEIERHKPVGTYQSK